jgi:hypothetical protein
MFTIQSNSIQTIKENIMTYFNGTLQEFTYLHEPIYESEHIIILDSDSTIGCQE